MRMIIDCDPGVDDMVALVLACSCRDVELLGVTTVAGNAGVETTTANASAILSAVGCSHVPVAKGCPRPLIRSNTYKGPPAHGDNGLGGLSLPNSQFTCDPRHAVELMADLVQLSDEPVTLVAIGPLTNVALFCARYPDIAVKVHRLVVMGGATGPGNITADAEFNVWYDPEAAYRVLCDPGLSADVDTVVVGLDLLNRILFDSRDIAALCESSGGALVAQALSGVYLDTFRRHLGFEAVPVYDAVAVLEAIQPGTVSGKRARISVDTGVAASRGRTLIEFVESSGTGVCPIYGTDADRKQVVGSIVERIANTGT